MHARSTRCLLASCVYTRLSSVFVCCLMLSYDVKRRISSSFTARTRTRNRLLILCAPQKFLFFTLTRASSLLLLLISTFPLRWLRCRRSTYVHTISRMSLNTNLFWALHIKRISFPVAFNMNMLMNCAHRKNQPFFSSLFFLLSFNRHTLRFVCVFFSRRLFSCVCEQTCWHFENEIKMNGFRFGGIRRCFYFEMISPLRSN